MVKEVDFLFINPWIYDFAAYDFWLKPYGFLKLAGLLRKEGYKVYYLDLLDPFQFLLPKRPKRNLYGTGHFYKEPIPKPSFFSDVPRRFFRYGLPFFLFEKEIKTLRFKALFLTTTMTYWYPGLWVLIDYFLKNYSQTPIFIGGIYSKLCRSHLEEFLNKYPGHLVEIIDIPLEDFLKDLKRRFSPSGIPYPYAYPVFDLQREIPYVILLTSIGCPYRCPYCASSLLFPKFEQEDPHKVIEEIIFWYEKFGVSDFAFYDDALLINFEKHLGIILGKILERGIKVRFHTPNALHARLISKEVALLLKRAGFKTIRLGLERLENRFDQKLTLEEFLWAIDNLKRAGFTPKEVGAYILYGLPEEDFEEVERTLFFLENLKVQPYLAEFSPIPGTPFFELAKAYSRYPLKEDPLFTNNSVFPALKKPDWERINQIKNMARAIRRKLQEEN